MSTLQVDINGYNVTCISGELTSDFEQMKRELGGQYESMFGDVKKFIAKLNRPKMTHEEIMQVYNGGLTDSFYENNNIWCYFCVRQSDYANYMFSPCDGENKDNRYLRLRTGVLKFSLEAGFDVYIINCA